MARFSLDGGDEIDNNQEDGSGPSNHRQPRKKLKIKTTAASAPPPPPSSLLPIVDVEEDISGAHEEDESESYDVEEEEEEESDAVAEEEEEEEEESEEQVNEEAVDNEEDGNDRKLILTITDPDVLDCSICFENLKSPVFQCDNGHIACALCCKKINNKCPSCSFPIGYNRCRAIEKILEASRVSCKNKKYGCKHVMKYYNKHEHEHECLYSPCSCPNVNCRFIGSVWKLYNHFESYHPVTNFSFGCLFSASVFKFQTFLVLKEEGFGTVFVLNRFTVGEGRSGLSVVQIAPESFFAKYRYEIEIKDGETSLALKSSVERVRKVVGYRSKKCFLVDDDYFSPLGYVNLDILIRPNG